MFAYRYNHVDALFPSFFWSVLLTFKLLIFDFLSAPCSSVVLYVFQVIVLTTIKMPVLIKLKKTRPTVRVPDTRGNKRRINSKESEKKKMTSNKLIDTNRYAHSDWNVTVVDPSQRDHDQLKVPGEYSAVKQQAGAEALSSSAL